MPSYTSVLVSPSLGKPLKLYISAAKDSTRSFLAQDSEDGTEQAVYYLSRLLNDAKTRYTPIEKMELSKLYIICHHSMHTQSWIITFC